MSEENKNKEKDSFPEEWKIFLTVTRYNSCPFQAQDKEAPTSYNCQINEERCDKTNCNRKIGRYEGGLIPYVMCLGCNAIYRADELTALPSDWNFNIHLHPCKNCETLQLTPICPFESYVKEVNESRCIIPLIMKPKKVTYGKSLESWYCIFHGKINECPVYAIFSGQKVR